MRQVLAGLVAFVVAAGAVLVLTSEPDETGADGEAEAFAGGFRPLLTPGERDVDPPTWRPGDTWEILFGAEAIPCIVSVVEATPGGYLHGTSCGGEATLALEDALHEHPHVGAFARDLSAPSAEEPMVFYRWPLQEGLEWETRWRGDAITITAHFVEQGDWPSGEPGYVLVGRMDGEPVMSYDFVPSLGWWSAIAFEGALSDEPPLRVLSHAPTWRGPIYSSIGERLYTYASLLTPVGPQAFPVDKDHDMLGFRASGSGGDFYAQVDLQGPTTAHGFQHGGASLGQTLGLEPEIITFIEADEGPWTLDVRGIGFAQFRYEVTGIRLDLWEP